MSLPSQPAGAVDLVGVGSPLVDLLVHIDDLFLERVVGGAKGGMELVEAHDIERMLAQSGREPVRAAGGAASNTAVAAACLGVRSAFIGAVGDDGLAEFYRQALAARRCEPRLAVNPAVPTGRVLALVTPDAQRTFRTCLGAAATLDPTHFTPETFLGTRVVMLEGYVLFNHALARSVIAAAKAAGAVLALDLASFEVVKANRDVIAELLPQVGIVFANQDEAAAWHDGGPEAALEALAGPDRLAIVKLGKDGSLIRRGSGPVVRVDTSVVQAVDTTGAGDCYAAGFLAAWLRGLPLDVCGRVGSKAGAAVVQVVGAQLSDAEWAPVRGYLDAWS